ncbi:unnamed protein product [Cylicostephanus goldi]|uniref:Uncharacterized protein n=1 Tax=Cylicostephanus goldi TaxID=71465 RepID=A0A3P7QNE4_CYLGO|nr:unnamed protein product [Cylicostephanus goldi]
MKSSAVVCLLHSLYNRLPPDALLLASFSLKTKAFRAMDSKADFVIDVNPIGLGFGKDVNGKMKITVWRTDTTPTVTELLYTIGDRSIKCFYPGAKSFMAM